MKIKRILIVSASFYPEISPRSFRTTELAKELSKQGHDVTVFVPFNGCDFLSYGKTYNLRFKDIGHLKLQGIEIKGGNAERTIRRFIRRFLSLLFEWPDIELTFKIPAPLRYESLYDMLISIAVPHPVHWGIALAKSKGINIARCWVADCGDPYMGDTTDSFRKLFYFKYVEKWFCRKADFLTVPFKGAISAYYPEFHEKIRIIPQGFNLEELTLPDYKQQNRWPVFAYAGGFIPGKRDPIALLNFLSEYQGDFNFIVFTSHKEILYRFKKLLGDKLDIREVIPRKDLLFELARMDFLINLDNNVTTQLPSKLIDYSIVGRPVLNLSQDDNFSTLIEFMNYNYTNQMKIESPDKYDIKRVAGQFLRLCE